MTSSTPNLISVVIPAFNSEKYIGDTVRSVLSQTHSHFELIVVDDGSDDRTAELAASAACGDSRVRVITTANNGVSAARNKGMSMATGAYIALLDSDDIWYPECLEKKMRILEKNSEVGWVFSDMALMDEEGRALLPHPPQGRDDNIIRNILLWEGEVVPGCCSNIFFRKKIFDNGVTFNTNLSTAADQEFCIKLAACSEGKHLPERLWRYRRHSSNMSRNVSLMERDHLDVYREAEEMGLFNDKCFRNRCYANLYLILAGSWWKDGRDKRRALKWLIRAALKHPQVVVKQIQKRL